MNTAPALVRWFIEAEADVIRDDHCHEMECLDLALLSYVFVAATVEDAKRIIQDTLADQEYLWDPDNDGQMGSRTRRRPERRRLDHNRLRRRERA